MARRSERLHLGEGSLLVLFLDQNAILADFPSEGPVATEVLSGPPLMALGDAGSSLIASEHRGRGAARSTRSLTEPDRVALTAAGRNARA